MSTKYIKICVVGDGAVGKTCLLWVYANNSYPEEYIPTVFDNYTCSVKKEENILMLNLWDTAGQEEYDNLRPLSYPGTHAFLVCYSIERRTSLENVTDKWIPELKHHVQKPLNILVGLKKDMREDSNKKCSSYEEGLSVQKKTKCDSYFECSAKTNDGVKLVFDGAIKAYLNNSNNQKIKNKNCQIL
jgi:Ras-related C3 botulinum toxin substrate 1